MQKAMTLDCPYRLGCCRLRIYKPMAIRSKHTATTAPHALRTPICETIGIEYPVFQAGMGWVARAELAAAVSEAGGLGVIGAGTDMAR